MGGATKGNFNLEQWASSYKSTHPFLPSVQARASPLAATPPPVLHLLPELCGSVHEAPATVLASSEISLNSHEILCTPQDLTRSHQILVLLLAPLRWWWGSQQSGSLLFGFRYSRRAPHLASSVGREIDPGKQVTSSGRNIQKSCRAGPLRCVWLWCSCDVRRIQRARLRGLEGLRHLYLWPEVTTKLGII